MIELTPDLTDLALAERDLNNLPDIFEKALERIAADLAAGYRKEAHAAGAVDTGAFVRGIAPRPVSAREFVLGSDVEYEGFINDGVPSRPSYPARHLDEKTIRIFISGDQIETRCDEVLFQFLHADKMS